MKKSYPLLITFLAVLLTVLVCPSFQVKATKGPRSDVDIQFYGSHEEAFAALKAGDVDFIQGSLTCEDRMEVEADPDLCIASIVENNMYEFDLNNNYTIASYPGVRNPLHVKEVRRAISCMVNKKYIVDEILMGAAEALNIPVSLSCPSWWPDCALPGNYPWAYNLTKAEEQLQLAGFVDTDSNGVRNYPVGWPGRESGPDMDPLIMYVRADDKRLEAGKYLANQLDLFGIPHYEPYWDPMWPPPWYELNYHIVTGGWGLGRYPTFLYWGFHSDFYYPWGSNYVTGMNESNLPNYPDYDVLAYQVYHADSSESFRQAAKAAAELGWCDCVFNVPLWSYKSFVAWRKTMAGIINMFGSGCDNSYQFLNAYNTMGGPIRMGTIDAPKALNPLYSMWYYDFAVLDRVFSSLLMLNPYDLAVDQPGAVQDWQAGTWIDPTAYPGERPEKTKLTYYLRKDCGVVAPNGTFIRNLNAHDLEFSCWYTYCFDTGWNWGSYMDVHHTNIVDEYTIEYYFDDYDFLLCYKPQYPILVRGELIDKLCTINLASFTSDGSNCTAGTQFKLTSEQIVQVTSDDLPVDYVIVGGYEDLEHNWIWLKGDLPAGTYTIEYYTPSLDPHGYYLAGLPWTETWYGFGPFYPTEIIPGVGGHASFNRNPYYWMPTPPKGEIDWRWVWNTPGGVSGPEVPGRDSGHYQINIYDVVKAAVSYGHKGVGPYDPQYFPGADINPNDLGYVSIYDIVTIASNYGMKWGTPPS